MNIREFAKEVEIANSKDFAFVYGYFMEGAIEENLRNGYRKMSKTQAELILAIIWDRLKSKCHQL